MSPFDDDPFDGFGKTFGKMAALSLVLNILFWAAMAGIVIAGLAIAGVI